jgi:LPS-assembly protein
MRAPHRLLAGTALLALLTSHAWAAATPKKTDPVLLQTDQIIYDGDNQTVQAQGHVEIDDAGSILTADNVIYNQATDTVTAKGHVTLTDTNGNVAFVDHLVLTDHMRDGALTGFGALIGENGRLAAASAQRIDGHMVIANHANYSPCKICNLPGQRTPVWQVKSEKVIYDQNTHRIHFQNATVDFFGVPILYTPVLSEPDPTVRYTSGLLAPDVGTSTKIGYFARQPIYVALSDTDDATLAPMVTTKGGALLQGEYRARWNNSGFWLQGSAAYNGKGGLGGSSGAQEYDHLFGSGRFALSDTWRTGFDTQLTNNTAYMRFYDLSALDRLVNDIFVEDDSGRSRLAATAYYFQGLRATDSQGAIPYVLPQIDLNYIPTNHILGGSFRFDLTSADLVRGTGPSSQRVTSEVNWKAPFIDGAGQVWTLTADARGDFFHIDNNDPLGSPRVPTRSRFIERAIPYVALDWRWPFLAQNAGGNHSYILQPIAQFIAQPYGGNDRSIPNEDGGIFEFNDANVFSFDQLAGYDRVESGPRANAGFIADAIYPGGEVEALVGQTYRLKTDPVFTSYSGERGTVSDIVGRLSIKLPNLSLTDRIDVDRANGVVRRHEVYLTGTYGRSSLQVSYIQLPPEAAVLGSGSREEVNTQADINFYENWQAFAAVNRDLLAGKMLDTEYGIGYEDECLAISLAYRRRYTADTTLGVPPSTSFILRFSLKNGDSQVQPFSLFPQNVFTSSHP